MCTIYTNPKCMYFWRRIITIEEQGGDLKTDRLRYVFIYTGMGILILLALYILLYRETTLEERMIKVLTTTIIILIMRELIKELWGCEHD